MKSFAGGALHSAALALALGGLLSGAPRFEAVAQALAPETAPVPAAANPDEPAAATEDAAMPVDVEEAAILTEDELDDLVAPIALYPDALLAQIFVASTYPLDVVKAARWTDQNKEMPEADRADAADAQGWDPSVAVLAAGFPQVVGRMADDLDQTELLGDALLTQSDDVLAAVQRQRARADAMGNLTVERRPDGDGRGRQHRHRAGQAARSSTCRPIPPGGLHDPGAGGGRGDARDALSGHPLPGAVPYPARRPSSRRTTTPAR